MTTDVSVGRIGMNDDHDTDEPGATIEKASFFFGFSEDWKAERAAESPRGTSIRCEKGTTRLPEPISEHDAASEARNDRSSVFCSRIAAEKIRTPAARFWRLPPSCRPLRGRNYGGRA
jgi:hypothetical protein